MIDRRIFLRLTGGVAAGAAGLAASSHTEAGVVAAPPGPPSFVHVGEGVVSSLADPMRLLGDRLALASGGRLHLEALSGANGSPFAPNSSVVLASEEEFAESEPTSLLLAGYPMGPGARELDVTTWLRGAGGQGLWDMAAARRGWKPVMVSMTGGAEAHLWSRVHLDGPRDLEGLRIAASRILDAPLEALDAVPVRADDMLAAFEAGAIDVFETDDPAVTLAASEQFRDRAHWYAGTLAGTSRVISLRIPLAQWQSLSPADQALIEAVAQETATTLQAVRRAHGRMLTNQIAEARQQRPASIPAQIRDALAREAQQFLPQSVRDEPLFASMLATMRALVAAPMDNGGERPLA
ncbi:hypothetical protein [Hyphomicrobium sp. CS1BSMeth3]|uniref:hypothetical protein n=1 Tax=Hyphomicrobium sp. CS1BSMeth3 TaxID=1892844 RepID=UPI000931B5F8|nr:hypothetical protein [Hyphomicrobium sp. CS1BSMeth3]